MYVNYSIKNQGIYDNSISFSSFQNGMHLLNLSVNSQSFNYAIYFNLSKQTPINLNFWNFTTNYPVEYVWFNETSLVIRGINTSMTASGTNLNFINNTFTTKGVSGYIYKLAFNGSNKNEAYNLTAGTKIDFVQLNFVYNLPSLENNFTIVPSLYYGGQVISISISTSTADSNLLAYPLK